MKLTLVALVLGVVIGLNYALAAEHARQGRQGGTKPQPEPYELTAESSNRDLRPRPVITSNNNYHVITCHECTDCPVVDQSTQHCIGYDSPEFMPPKCITFSRHYPGMDHDVVVRGCSTIIGDCTAVKNQQIFNKIKLNWCHECDSDLCNGALTTKLSLALLAVLMIPTMFKFLM